MAAIAGCVVGGKPFEIAFWCGRIHEPDNVEEFFKDFVGEAKALMDEGFAIDGVPGRFSFAIDKYIADALARAWMMQTVIPPGSFFCCERCIIKGERICHRTIFNPKEECILRTNDSLINQEQKEQHNGITPLLPLGTQPLSQVPIELMHCVDLGNFRRFYEFLLTHTKRISKVYLTNAVIEDLSKHLMSLKPFYPSEFNRDVRPLTQWTTYKATEFRRLGLYDSFFLFRQLEDTKVSKVHCLLGCAIRILSDKGMARFRSDADRLLRQYVIQSAKLFGELFTTFNVHCLIHLTDETSRHGCLDDFAAWKFETFLGQLKKDLRAPGRTLQQIVCRVLERRTVHSARKTPKVDVKDAIVLSQPHNRGPTTDETRDNGGQFRSVSARDLGLFRISSLNDRFFVSRSGEVCVLRNVIKIGGDVKFVYNGFLESSNYFDFPFASKLLGIVRIRNLGPLKTISVRDVKRKAVVLPLHKDDIKEKPTFDWMNDVECLCLPMLHHPSDDT